MKFSSQTSQTSGRALHGILKHLDRGDHAAADEPVTNLPSPRQHTTVHIQLSVSGKMRKLRGLGSYAQDPKLGDVLHVRLQDSGGGGSSLLFSTHQLRRSIGSDFRNHDELHLHLDVDTGTVARFG